MKITCDREMMSDSLARVAGVIQARSPMPVIQHAKIVATELGSFLIATDLEAEIRLKLLGVTADEPGEAILPMPRFAQLLKSSPDDEVVLESAADILLVRSRSSKFRLPGMDPSSFPEFGDHETDVAFSVDPVDLHRAIRRTIFAADPNSSRHAIAGVSFMASGGVLEMAAMDSRRLSVQGIPCDDVPDFAATVPVKALKLLDRNLDAEGPVEVSVRDGRAINFRCGRATISSRLVEGQFPAYRSILPKAFDSVASFEGAGGLLSAVASAAVVTSKESRGVELRFSGGVLRLGVRSADIGESDVEVPTGYDGPDFSTRLDSLYLMESLRAIDPGQAMTFAVAEPKRCPVLATGDGFTHMLMPLEKE